MLVFAHSRGTLAKGAGRNYFALTEQRICFHLNHLGLAVRRQYAICCLNTQPAGKLTSGRLHIQRLAFALFRWLEYTPLSRYLLRRMAPLYVMIGRKE